MGNCHEAHFCKCAEVVKTSASFLQVFSKGEFCLCKCAVHSGQAGGQNSWETKFHKRVRQSGQMIGLHGHDHESLFGTLGSLIGPLEAPQNDQKPLKMAILGTFKHPSQT